MFNNNKLKVLFVTGCSNNGRNSLSNFIENSLKITISLRHSLLQPTPNDDQEKLDFLEKVSKEFCQNTGDKDISVYKELQQQVEENVLAVLCGRVPLKLREAYISRTESLFAAMAKISGKEVMLDITGSPGRLAALSLCPNLKVIPLLLVRDVSEEAQEIPPPSYLGRVFTWLSINFISLVVMRKFERRIIIRLKELYLLPVKAIQRIATHIDVDLSDIEEVLRRKKSCCIPTPDPSFRKMPSWGVRLLAELVSFPLTAYFIRCRLKG